MNTDPLSGDDWADLAEELGVSDTKPLATPLPEVSAVEELDEADEESVEVVSEEEDDTAEGVGDADEDEPRKRRRRRRRRRKKGQPDPAAADAVDDDVEEVADDATDDDEPSDVQRGESLEDSTPEAARDLIQNWNVPSWEEIVSGLYRPER